MRIFSSPAWALRKYTITLASLVVASSRDPAPAAKRNHPVSGLVAGYSRGLMHGLQALLYSPASVSMFIPAMDGTSHRVWIQGPRQRERGADQRTLCGGSAVVSPACFHASSDPAAWMG